MRALPAGASTARRTSRGPAAVLAATLFAGPAPPMEEVSLPAMAGRIATLSALSLSGRGLELEVDGEVNLVLPLPGAQELEVECESSGILLLTYAATDGARRPRPFGPPWRYRRLAGRETLRLDLRLSPDWGPASFPFLVLQGSGHLTFVRLRARPAPSDPASAWAAQDRAVFWAPVAIDHTTINSLDPPMWRATKGTFLYQRLGPAMLGIAALAGLGILGLRRRWRPRLALAIAAVAVAVCGDALFLAKLLPSLNLSIEPDPEVRIRENYFLNPELGGLASLARSTLRPSDRVGVMRGPGDWFAPELLCFNLAPRRCVTVEVGEREYVGISGVDRLRPDELDAIVWYRADAPLPAGFVPVAQVSRRALVARRP